MSESKSNYDIEDASDKKFPQKNLTKKIATAAVFIALGLIISKFHYLIYSMILILSQGLRNLLVS